MNSLLKQRIVGAIVLVALGVIFIPMFLSGEGEMVSDMGSNVPPKPAYELEAPKVLPLNPAAKQQQATASAQGIPGEPVKKPIAPLPGQDPNVPLPGEMTADKPVETVKAEVDIAKINTDDKITAATKLETGNNSTPTSKISNSIFAATPTVTEKSVTVSNEKISTQSKPPTSTQSAASTSMQSSKSATTTSAKSTAEATGTIEPEPVQTAKVAKPVPIVNGYVVQLGSFSVEKNAVTLRDKLRSSGHASFVEKFTKNSKISYRVRVGPELTRELAEKLKTKLKQQTKIDGFIVKYP